MATVMTSRPVTLPTLAERRPRVPHRPGKVAWWSVFVAAVVMVVGIVIGYHTAPSVKVSVTCYGQTHSASIRPGGSYGTVCGTP